MTPAVYTPPTMEQVRSRHVEPHECPRADPSSACDFNRFGGRRGTEAYPITRAWAMPNPETFSIPPVAAFIERWYRTPSVDPFARDSSWATYTNDLSPETAAQEHMEAADFCAMLDGLETRAACVLFDPPYSPRQMAEVYQSIGRRPTTADTQNARLYQEVRDGLDRLLDRGGIALSFGWNSAGFGKGRGYEVVEILLVAHGGAHNDTICVAERKR